MFDLCVMLAVGSSGLLRRTGKGGVHVVRVVWAPRRLGAQEPLRVSCPRVCIELMYQSSGYRTRFDVK